MPSNAILVRTLYRIGTHMAERFLRMPAVEMVTGLKRATIYLRISQGLFPKPVQLGTPNAVGWLESEIESWVSSRIAASRGESEPAPLHQTA
jgi:prophage regulatory protein